MSNEQPSGSRPDTDALQSRFLAACFKRQATCRHHMANSVSRCVVCVIDEAVEQLAVRSERPLFTAVGMVNSLKGCTSTKYEPGRLPDGERMLYIATPSPNERYEQPKEKNNGL